MAANLRDKNSKLRSVLPVIHAYEIWNFEKKLSSTIFSAICAGTIPPMELFKEHNHNCNCQICYQFLKQGSGSKVLTIFQIKCAVVALLGINIPVKEIGRTLVTKCAWQSNSAGVSLKMFSAFISITKLDHLEDGSVNHNFSVIDTNRKGWVNENDLHMVAQLYFSHNFELPYMQIRCWAL